MTTEAMARIEQDGLILVQQAEEIRVTDSESFQGAGAFLRRVTAGIRMGHELMDPICDAAHTAHRVATAQRTKLLEPFEAAKKIVGAETSAWEQSERDRVAREQRAADAERRRLEDEARLAMAADLEKAGKPEAAARALTAPVTVPVFTPPVQAVPKADGISFSDQWGEFTVTDEALIPREYWVRDDQKIRRVIRALKGETKIPGIDVLPPTRKSSVRT